MFTYTVFDAFTGISPFEKLGVIKFLESSSNQSKEQLQQSVDYAVKDCPSFGGYILSVNSEKKPIGVAVINKTGIPSAGCKNLLVQFSIDPEFQTAEFITHFFKRIVDLTNKDISLQLNASDPNIHLLESIGFKAHKVEFRFEEQVMDLEAKVAPKKKISRKARKRKNSKLRVAV